MVTGRRPEAATPLRDALVLAAYEMVCDVGRDGLRARDLAARCGTSTQAIYTLLGGMPALLDAVVARGFGELTGAVVAVAETDDPVADFFARGIAYGGWALSHPRVYAAMFAPTDDDRRRVGLALGRHGRQNSAEGRTALAVLTASMARVVDAGRADREDAGRAARQFLAATHGYVALELAGAFGDDGSGVEVGAALATNLMIGLGDDREATDRSWRVALAAASGDAAPGAT